MRARDVALSLAALSLFAVPYAVPTASGAAEGWAVDPDHSAVMFRIKHLDLSYSYGRFNSVSGAIQLDAENPAASSVNLEVKAGTIDTNSAKRDEHLRGADFLNVAQFPTISFKSTSVKKGSGKNLDVTGDFTLHGTTKSVTVTMEHVGQGKDPWGGHRTGFEGTLTIKRSDYGMKVEPGLSDEVRLTLAIEAMKK